MNEEKKDEQSPKESDTKPAGTADMQDEIPVIAPNGSTVSFWSTARFRKLRSQKRLSGADNADAPRRKDNLRRGRSAGAFATHKKKPFDKLRVKSTAKTRLTYEKRGRRGRPPRTKRNPSILRLRSGRRKLRVT
jgi:hypothetical protein